MPVESSYHIWKVIRIEIYSDRTVIHKTVQAKVAHLMINSDSNSFIENAETGEKYYITASSLGLKGIKQKIKDTDIHSFTETYPPLPGGIRNINIYMGNKMFAQDMASHESSEHNTEISNVDNVPETRVLPVTVVKKVIASAPVENKTNPVLTKDEESVWVDQVPSTGIVADENVFAFIFCNENYKYIDKVPYALNDGQIFQKYCSSTLGLGDRNITLIQDATGNDMKYHVDRIKKIMDAYSGKARVIFYYSGHGIPDEKTGDAYLLPVDGYATDMSTAFSLETLYSSLGEYPAESVVVILDACFSGRTKDDNMLSQARGVRIKKKEEKIENKNMVVISAAQGDETAYPFKENKHGLFTYYFLKKLKDTNGRANLGEISSYLISEVRKTSITANGKSQTPTVSAPSGNEWEKWKLY